MTSLNNLKIFLLLLAAVTTTQAWVPSSAFVGRKSTALGLFDWFNPKAKPTPAPTPAPAPEPVAETPEPDFDDKLKEFFEKEGEASSVAGTNAEEVKDPEPTKEEEVKEEPITAAVAATDQEVHTGTVKWYNPNKGFGFIAGKDNVDVFVHQTELQADGFRTLVDGETVEYVVKSDDTGRLRAVHVTGPEGGDLTITLRRKERKEQEEKEK